MDKKVWRVLQQIVYVAVLILLLSSCTGSVIPPEATVVGTIITVAGTGESGYSVDGDQASKARLDGPISLALDPSDNLFIGEYTRIRTVDSMGRLSTVAGVGNRGYTGDGTPAIEAEFNMPRLSFDGEGNLWVLNHFQPSLRKIDPNGIISRIAGTGNEGQIPEDGSLARNVPLCGVPFGPAIDADGNAYISCEFGHVVLMIDTDGHVFRFAGTGEPGFSGDGGSAREAQLFAPMGLAFNPQGDLFIVDGLNSRIRKIDTNGIITTVAGIGTPGYSGDGGPATDAEISPLFIDVDQRGNIYFSSHTNRVVRKIDTNGHIHTVAGGGQAAESGEGGPSNEAYFKGAGLDIALDNQGNLFIADDGDHRVRKVTFTR